MMPTIIAFLRVLACISLGLVLIGQVSPARAFNIKKINVPGARDTWVSGINDLGIIVGYYHVGPSQTTGYYRGFLYNGVNFTTIHYTGADNTYIYGINNAGHVVGAYDSAGVTRGFKYDGSSYSPLEVSGASASCAYGINNSSKIVGAYTLSGSTHGFIYGGQFQYPIDYPSAVGTYCYGLNDSGKIVGSYTLTLTVGGAKHGFVYDPNLAPGLQFTPVDVPGATTTNAYGINDKGQIVGDFSAAAYPKGFIYNGSSYQIIPNTYFGGNGNSLYAINKFGQKAGSYSISIMLPSPPYTSDFYVHGFVMKSLPPPLLLLLD
jgi:probable HAF family extracellular repeat protein